MPLGQSLMPDKVNILVVDDLQKNLLVHESVLAELDQNLVMARSGTEALRHVLDKDFAVILLDVNMPDLDGYETASMIRRRKKSAHTPIIFITAYADEMHTAHGYTLGAVDFILSPVNPEILRTKVRVFVDLFRMTQQVKKQAEEQVALAHAQAARSAAEESVRRLNFLAEASKVLASSLDLEATLRGLLGLVVTRSGDIGIITLFNEDGLLRHIETAWVGPAGGIHSRTLEGRDVLPDTFLASLQRVVRAGKPEYLQDEHLDPQVRQMWHALIQRSRPGGESQPLRATAILPLIARNRAIGALSIAMEQPGRWQAPADLALIEDLAHRAAIAIDNALLYRDIQDADRRKNEFLSMLAHELRNPMAPLLNGIHLLRQHNKEGYEVQKVQEMMDRQIHHLVRLVDDLLDISRITRDMIELQVEPVEVSAVVQRAVEVSRPLLDSRLHELTLTLPSQPVWVKADAVRLAQVLSNLLNNAAKYTEKRGKVWLSAERVGAEVVFRVRDNGVGIPPDMLSSVFDLFTQVKRSSDRSQGGLGIGLTLVRRLVEMHGGTVQAHCAGLNQGSEFVVRLPILADMEAPATTPTTADPAIANGHQRILVVDDNVDVTESTGMLLRQIGLDVRLAHDGPAALAVAGAFKPHVVLLDIGLPGMDGYEVARRLRQQFGSGTPLLVALSGYGQEEDRQRSHEAGFDHHLVKPATLIELTAILSHPHARSRS
jgi:signal transduction histidine kinase/DNA-binding response OmpR family regulator